MFQHPLNKREKKTLEKPQHFNRSLKIHDNKMFLIKKYKVMRAMFFFLKDNNLQVLSHETKSLRKGSSNEMKS